MNSQAKIEKAKQKFHAYIEKNYPNYTYEDGKLKVKKDLIPQDD